jgi:hypothetical protein
LLVAEFWYNMLFHSAPGRSPFEALYGRQQKTLGLEPPAAAHSNLADWLSECANMTHFIHGLFLRAQVRMKRQASRCRSERQFDVAIIVYLKLHPYVQDSVMPRAN